MSRLILLHLVLSLISFHPSFSELDPRWKTFVGSDSNPLMLVDVHKITGDVFVAARNTLYHLDEDLVLKKQVLLGPKSVCATPSDNDCATEVKDDNPHALRILYHLDSPMLLLCGSLYDGRCQVRLLEDLDRYFWIGPDNDSVAYVTAVIYDPAFFGLGYGNQLVFYSGSDTDTTSKEPDEISRPFISSKVLLQENGQFRFQYSARTNTSLSGIFFPNDSKRILLYGFVHGLHVYFLYRFQKNGIHQTILARVCIDDGSFHSYTEQPVSCRVGDRGYELAVTAFFGEARQEWKRKISASEKELYISYFVKDQGAAICGFPMTHLDDLFANVTRDCFGEGSFSKLLKPESGEISDCHKKTNLEDSDFCGSSINPYITSEKEVFGEGLYSLNSPSAVITALAVYQQQEQTIAFIGTVKAVFAKIHLDLMGENLHAETTDGELIRSSLAFDTKKHHIYFLVENKIVKYPINTCSLHKTCRDCFFQAENDPLGCGWCDGHCAHLTECDNLNNFSRDKCSPTIRKFTPLMGSTYGGTTLTIEGINFGSSNNKSVNSVFVAGSACTVLKWEDKRVECVIRALPYPTSGPVQLVVTDTSTKYLNYIIQGTAVSRENFTYVTPKIYGIYPSSGSASGGTNVTLFGDHLDIGDVQLVNINGRNCSHIHVEKTTIRCVTGTVADSSLKDAIEVQIDTTKIEIEVNVPSAADFGVPLSPIFKYLPNPEIFKIDPSVSIVSFAGNITVTGRYLDITTEHQMLVTIGTGNLEFQEPCWLEPESHGSVMKCSLPDLKSKNVTVPKKELLVTQVAFIMDGVKLSFPQLTHLVYYPDPEYKPFQEVQKLTENQTLLEIKGRYSDFPYLDKIIKVEIGENELCSISALTFDTLQCILPPELMSNASVWGKKVSVQVSTDSHQHHIGYLMVMEPKTEHAGDEVLLLIIIGVLVILCLTAIVVGRWLCRKRRLNQFTKLSVQMWSDSAVTSYRRDYHPVATSRHVNTTTAVPPDERTTVTSPLEMTTVRKAADDTSCAIPEASTIGYLDMKGYKPNCDVPVNSRSAAVTGVGASQMLPGPLTPVKKTCVKPIATETMSLLATEKLIIPRETLTLSEVIGVGQFGCVYKGELQKNGENIKVAVKTIRNYSEVKEKDVKEFLEEGVMMKAFQHANVLTLIGVCFEDGMPMVVTPFMVNGDLCSYIRNPNNILWVADLAKFGVDIATGMAYLADNRFVHRDLAARNCVLDQDLRAKVSDFGLARDVYESDYYMKQNDRKLPYKWMAPESIESETYSEKSDVWSYGILLWEILTRGVVPYENFQKWMWYDQIKAGYRLPKPQCCSEKMYEVMLKCWETDPLKRPAFQELERVVRHLWKAASYEDRLKSAPAQNHAFPNLEYELS